MPSCPFYGVKWPANQTALVYSGHDECGLDWDDFGPCRMERQGLTPDYYRCPVVAQMQPTLTSFRLHIVIANANGRNVTLAQWEEEPR